jgi:hypothetical protein
MKLAFFFDPACPWTWVTFKWLQAAVDFDLSGIRFGAVSLLELNKDADLDQSLRSQMVASRRLSRVIMDLVNREMREELVALYRSIGTEAFDLGKGFSEGTVLAILEKDNIGGWRHAYNDPALDEAVLASHRQALDLAGQDVGSPILADLDIGRGFYGPILDAPLERTEAEKLFIAIRELMAFDHFYELKRGHTSKNGPVFNLQ